jgi:hypothetical protein
MTKFRPTSAPLVVGERFRCSWFCPGRGIRSFDFSSKDQAHHIAKACGRNRVEIAGLDLVRERNPAPLPDAFVTKSAA